ncbi:DUF5123 domain-containing protein [Flavobacterium sp. FZUC8N2.13]|uniref:DUF5123 domain-containing protein n=1 Tax=Flavobacterium zubiriense TaxID=3138075 RepID=A0ABV4TE48_9FLAO
MRKFIIKIFLASLLVIGSLMSSCTGYNEDVIDMLEVNRAFAPVELEAFIRTQTTVELNWTPRDNVDHYVVEFSADDPNFTTIARSLEVSASELPLKVQMEGETVYSIRVKAVVNGLEDSKWTTITATTLSEQIFTAIIDGDIASKEATLRWVAGSNVTSIVLTPGGITHAITAEEKANGIAMLTGLSPETTYQAVIYNGTKKRGVVTFTTGIDIGDGILVKSTDDLLVVIANADSGAKLFLEPGEYKSFGTDGVTPNTDIILAKSITISGIPGKTKPVLRYKVTVNAGTSNVSLLDLELDGRVYNTTSGLFENITNASVISVTGATSNYGDFLISGCNIHDYTRALISANVSAARVNSFTVENSIITNVNTNIGADFIDFRNTYVANVTLKNSTFDKCSTSRDFVRIDAASGLSNTGLITTVLIDACTIHNSTMTATNRILYVRFLNNVLTVRKTLFANTPAIYSNQANTAIPTFTDNNYFNSPNFKDATITNNKVDAAGTTLDPGFTNAATGDFTISNQTLKDRIVGDPRWIK